MNKLSLTLFLTLTYFFACVEGPTGPVGAPGKNGIISINGDSLVCAQDPGNDTLKRIKVLIGATGDKGLQGPQGIQGPQGLKGDPGITGLTGVSGKSYSNEVKDLITKIKIQESAILRVDVYRFDGISYTPISFGSGTRTVIDGQSYVVTALHVTKDNLSFNPGRIYADKFLLYSNNEYVGQSNNIRNNKIFLTTGMQGRDIALIKCDEILSSVSEIPMKLNYDPEIGDLTITASYPAGLDMDRQFTVGFISDDNADSSLMPIRPIWSTSIITDAAVTHGSSGGPVFDKFGNFIGIEVGGFNTSAPDNLNLAVQLLFR